ncbi:di-heme oxidoredictase family protein [Mesorhizobium sp. LNJC405B00]|uniref:di-heme oxidoreductase family protein n=1 Tax=Mesorhizobium sp. LNJC405B00 TaxID=1287281 RepID=UPI0003CEA7D5|nr:di-heme oxidoredictase family protein [Mesorhizobium sp. LNJC405B00]ESX93000.1 thiol oxidoreductase [Mesorhizobium sp. LNJC405B00]
MRRPIDILRRLRRAAGPLLLKNPRYQAFRGLSVVTLAAILAPALAGSSEPVGLATSRTDLTPKDQARVLAVTRPTQDFSKPESFETMQGGAGTSRKQVDRDAFSQPSENITFEEQGNFKLGNALFRKNWVSSPSSTQASDGLGPLFNERACQNCHLKDGRGRPPAADSRTTSMFLRLARDASTAEEKTEIAAHKVLNFPDPVYGAQLQELAVPGLKGEGRMYVDYREEKVTLGDGSVVWLRQPSYSVDGLGYGPLDPRTTLSPRLTPPMIGLGLIEQIAPADLLAHADPDDRDGISGKPNMVRDLSSGQLTLGRFGWKAQTASIRQQAADAFADIGISTPEEPSHWGDCTAAEKACLDMPNGVQKRLGPIEAPPPVMDLVTFYSQNLAVPARRDVGAPAVLAGKKLFYEMGCIACHTPKFVTMRGNKAQAFQLIWPYSDFLLHDMGPGLADGQAVGDATGSEWRTPPLWGIGLTKTVNGNAFFLHDGRARTLTEAILWHGGEGQKARDRFAAANTADRDALIKFLESF